jgi:hypothetical protein
MALAVAILPTSGCSKLLQDDFESYSVDQPLGGDIPGAPSCDRIETEGDAPQFAISPTNAIAGDFSLNFEPAFANGPSQIDFLPCEPASSDSSVRFRWRGRLSGPADSPGVHVRITDGDAILFRAYLFFNITRSAMEIGSAGTVIHTIPGDFSRPHSVIARIVPGTQDQYFVAIVGEGVNPNDASPEGTLSHLMDFQPKQAFLRMQWQPGTSVSEVYLVDDVIIEQAQ